jgi:hypothetical protein
MSPRNTLSDSGGIMQGGSDTQEVVHKEGEEGEEGEEAGDGVAGNSAGISPQEAEAGGEEKRSDEKRSDEKHVGAEEDAKTMSLAHLSDDWWRPVLLQLSMVAPPMAIDDIITTIIAAADPSTIQQLLAFATYNSVPRLVACLRTNEVPMPMTFAKPQGGGMLPLHHACSASLPSILQVRALLAVHPKGVCQPDKVLHRLPLHYACDSKHTTEALVQSLLAEYPEGAKQVDDNGRLPFHYFSLSGSSNEGAFRVLHTANPVSHMCTSVNNPKPLLTVLVRIGLCERGRLQRDAPPSSRVQDSTVL